MKRSIPLQRDVLTSFHYFRDYDLDRLCNLRIIGDSGAFSAKTQGVTITVEDLAEWGAKWRHRLFWLASLDVIGNQEATYRNWRTMVDVHGLRPVPTIHFGANPRELDRYANHGCDMVGLGGLVGVQRKPAMRWLIQVFQYARRNHPDMRFHGWGCTSIHHSLLPFYSVDSSSWTSGFRFGTLKLIDPRTGKTHGVKMDGHEALHGEPARLLRDYYGVNPTTVSTSTPENRHLLIKVASMSVSARQQYLLRKHGTITAPQWINPTDGDGPIEFAAASTSGNASAERIADIISPKDTADGPQEFAASPTTDAEIINSAFDTPTSNTDH